MRRMQRPGEEKPKVTAKRKQARSAEATRAKIQRAAKRLFADRGFVATTIRQIAHAASIEGGSVYYHFRGKQGMLAAIFEAGNQTLLEAAEVALVDAPSDPTERLCRLVHTHLRILAADPAQFIVVTRELQRLTGEPRRRIMEQREAYERLFRSALEDGMAQDVFRQCDAKLVSYGIIGLLNSVTYWYDPKGPYLSDAIAEEYTRLLVTGLGSGGGALESAIALAAAKHNR